MATRKKFSWEDGSGNELKYKGSTMAQRYGREKCQKCIYRNESRTGLPNPCNYILIKKERRKCRAEDCKIGLDPANQGKAIPIQVKFEFIDKNDMDE